MMRHDLGSTQTEKSIRMRAVLADNIKPSISLQGCQSRDHRVKIRGDLEAKIHKILMTHRDLICLCPQRRSGIKIAASEVNSITLPVPIFK